MTYSLDLRQRVIKFVTNGGMIVEAAGFFAVNRKTISGWMKLDDLRPKAPPKSRVRKLNQQALLEHVKQYPDMILRQRANHFGVRINAVWYQFKKLGITLKKNDKIPGKKTLSTYQVPTKPS